MIVIYIAHQNNMLGYFDILPEEICVQIFNQIGSRAHARCCGVNHAFYRLMLSRSIAAFDAVSLVAEQMNKPVPLNLDLNAVSHHPANTIKAIESHRKQTLSETHVPVCVIEDHPREVVNLYMFVEHIRDLWVKCVEKYGRHNTILVSYPPIGYHGRPVHFRIKSPVGLAICRKSYGEGATFNRCAEVVLTRIQTCAVIRNDYHLFMRAGSLFAQICGVQFPSDICVGQFLRLASDYSAEICGAVAGWSDNDQLKSSLVGANSKARAIAAILDTPLAEPNIDNRQKYTIFLEQACNRGAVGHVRVLSAVIARGVVVEAIKYAISRGRPMCAQVMVDVTQPKFHEFLNIAGVINYRSVHNNEYFDGECIQSSQTTIGVVTDYAEKFTPQEHLRVIVRAVKNIHTADLNNIEKFVKMLVGRLTLGFEFAIVGHHLLDAISAERADLRRGAVRGLLHVIREKKIAIKNGDNCDFNHVEWDTDNTNVDEFIIWLGKRRPNDMGKYNKLSVELNQQFTRAKLSQVRLPRIMYKPRLSRATKLDK